MAHELIRSLLLAHSCERNNIFFIFFEVLKNLYTLAVLSLADNHRSLLNTSFPHPLEDYTRILNI